MWRYLKREIMALSRDLRIKLQGMIKRIVEAEKVLILKQNGVYSQQKVVQGDIVHVKFVGIGSVINLPHFAIVWEAKPSSDHILVLPLTSQPKPDYDLGTITGMNKPNNVVKMNQLQCISRKSFTTHKRRGVQVALSPEQLLRVREMFRKFQLQEKTLSYILTNDIGLRLPLFISSNVEALLQKTCTYSIIPTGQGLYDLHFITTENPIYHKIELVSVSMKHAERKRILRNLTDPRIPVRTTAQNTISHIYSQVTAAAVLNSAAPATQSP